MSSSSSRHGALTLRDRPRPTFRARRVHVVPPSVLMLEPFVEAFSATFGVPLSDIKIANDEALDHTTIHDNHGGVQWMYLQDWQAGRGSVVLNLEGLEYDGWPIARLLERELASAAFLYQQQCNLPVAHYRELRRTIALPLIASERPSVEA